MKAKIGLTLCIDDERMIKGRGEYYYINRKYSISIKNAGAIPILLNPEMSVEETLEICDGLVISGGNDIPPELYKDTKKTELELEILERIQWERNLIDAFDKHNKPILGICYGMQLLNVHFGGNLHQDIRLACKNPIEHGGTGNKITHRVNIVHESSLFPVLGSKLEVASMHHQCIDRLASKFIRSAYSDDGVIEAIEAENILGLEWHPEADSSGLSIFPFFLSLIDKNKK